MNIKKIFVNIMFYSWVLLYFSNSVLAGTGTGIDLDDSVIKTLTEITSILLLVGAAICIGKCIHIGILYTLSSAVDKSNAKQAMLPWLIGTFVCFGAATIGSFVINTLKIDRDVLEY